jgi:Transposase DDE domain
MATSGKGTGIVGYNVQVAVDSKHHLIIAHEVTNFGNDRAQLSNMAQQAREAGGHGALTVIADRGYFKGEEILACEKAGMTPLVPKPLTSGAKAEGRFGKQDFVYIPEDNVYRCPTRALLLRRGFALDKAFQALKLLVEHAVDPGRPLFHAAADVAADDIALRDAGAALCRFQRPAECPVDALHLQWAKRTAQNATPRLERRRRPANAAPSRHPSTARKSTRRRATPC